MNVFGSAMLEVAIGLIFVFLLVSIICSAIREGIEARLKTRAAYLERGIRELLHDAAGKGLARTLYEHPLISSLYSEKYTPGERATGSPTLLAKGAGLPSYIPARSFATALMDIAARGVDPALGSDPRTPVMSLESVRANIINLECEPVQRVMLTAIDTAHGNLDHARLNIEAWFDSGMDRVSGWYKRSTQWIIFWIALFVAVALNVNTITIVDFLYRDDTARAAIVARAEAASADTAFITRNYAEARQELEALSLPIGWASGWGAPGRPSGWLDVWNGLFGPLFGWLLTALAATMGAPFWFDLLNKVMVIRSTVKPHEKSPEEGSEDRQPKTSKTSRTTSTPPTTKATTTTEPAEAPEQPAGTTAVPHAEQPPGPGRAVLEDACDIPIVHVTLDEDLPPAEGGVA
jgi:hypothetical protein